MLLRVLVWVVGFGLFFGVGLIGVALSCADVASGDCVGFAWVFVVYRLL